MTKTAFIGRLKTLVNTEGKNCAAQLSIYCISRSVHQTRGTHVEHETLHVDKTIFTLKYVVLLSLNLTADHHFKILDLPLLIVN